MCFTFTTVRFEDAEKKKTKYTTKINGRKKKINWTPTNSENDGYKEISPDYTGNT